MLKNPVRKAIVMVITSGLEMIVISIIEEQTGLRLNQVCGSLGKGGGSTDGN